MKCDRALLLFLFCFSAWAMPESPSKKLDSPDLERQRLTHPKVGVILVTQRELKQKLIHPVFPTFVEQSGWIYFSKRADGIGQACPATKLFKFPLSANVEKREIKEVRLHVWDFEKQDWTEPRRLCIEKVHTDGARVYVHYWDGEHLEFARLEESEATNRLYLPRMRKKDKVAPWLNAWQINWQMDILASTLDYKLAPYTFLNFKSFSKDSATFVARREKDNLTFLCETSFTQGKLNLAAKLFRLPEVEEKFLSAKKLKVIHAHFGNKDYVYLPYHGASREVERLGGFYVVNRAQSKEGRLSVVARYGGAFSIPRRKTWDSLEAKKWAIRYIDFTSPSLFGLLVVDSTDRRANENATMSYFSPEGGASFYKVKGPSIEFIEDLGGIQYYANGFFAALQDQQRIAFVGEKNPFSKDFKTRGPDLRGAPISER